MYMEQCPSYKNQVVENIDYIIKVWRGDIYVNLCIYVYVYI